MVLLTSCLDWPCGTRSNILVDICEQNGSDVFGKGHCLGEPVFFQHEGLLNDTHVTLYNVVKTGARKNESWYLQLDGYSRCFGSHNPQIGDLGAIHDVCCGLGGFSFAAEFLSMRVVSAVDISLLATQSYDLNFVPPSIHGDIASSSTIVAMHEKQVCHGCQPLLTAGFPCQPLSSQGLQRRHRDSRSQVLPAVLRAAICLNACGLLLECVPEAMNDVSTQAYLHEYATLMGCHIFQKVLQLHTLWPSKRARWFAVIIRKSLGTVCFPDLPCMDSVPRVQDVIKKWPKWPVDEEKELLWTDLECQVYRDPTFGNPDRRLKLHEPLPTALHSWGNALYGCPCLCRSGGLSRDMLILGGLRGVEVLSLVFNHASRHIHPRELLILLGFPPFMCLATSCRAALCLLGNAVSPIHCIWILAHLRVCLRMPLQDRRSPQEVLQLYIQIIMNQLQCTWPPQQTSGDLSLVLSHGGFRTVVAFKHGARIEHLIKAELAHVESCDISCVQYDGIVLPFHAFLQPRKYEIIQVDSCPEDVLFRIHYTVQVFGVSSHHVGRLGMTVGQAVAVAGLSQWHQLHDHKGSIVEAASLLFNQQHIVVLQNPDDVELDLHLGFPELFAEGFGPECPGQFRTSPSWGGGLWHLDQIVSSHLMSTWAGSGFAPVAVWLPSFAEAVLELWPSTVEDHLRSWLKVTSCSIHAIVRETWGWTVVAFHLDRLTFRAKYFVPSDYCACEAHRLAYRAHQAGGRPCFSESWQVIDMPESPGSLAQVFAVLDQEMGLSLNLQQTLERLRKQQEVSEHNLSRHCLVSATIPLTCSVDQLPIPPAPSTKPESYQGLHGKFILDFARAVLHTTPSEVLPYQVRVISLDGLVPEIHLCQVASFDPAVPPVFVFVLARSHWTLLHCQQHNDQLRIRHYDGLAQTSLSCIAPVCAKLKDCWGCRGISIINTWNLVQTKPDSCGTIAIGHFLGVLGLAPEPHCFDFESLHSSFAACSALAGHTTLQGFGPEEEAIVRSLEQILPSKGVAASDVANRAQAAIRVLGAAQISKALESKNTWAALKSLGNSKPKPFMWVTHQELQQHIKWKAESRFGADVDIKRSKKQRDNKTATPAVTKMLDPSALMLPKDVFVSNQGVSVPQISLQDVQKNGVGIAFATPQDALHFLQDGKFISTETLSLLVVGPIPDNFPNGLPMSSARIPAIYKGTNEPVILDCTQIQLGDQAVYRRNNTSAPALTIVPTVVFRVHVFQDLWVAVGSWESLISKPVGTLVDQFPILRLCKEEACTGCEHFHPAIEEQGIEAALLDVWGFHWHKHDGAKAQPHQADVLSIYIRVPESCFHQLHVASGTCGFFFEPRRTDVPGPDQNFAVVWIAGITLNDALHRVKTIDQALAACRLGNEYGLRCQVKNEEQLHKAVCPSKPFVACAIKEVYKLEPLPAGTQRQSLVDAIKTIGWKAKPLQPTKGSQGKAWNIGAEGPPPQPFIETQFGWATITKVKAVTPQLKTQDIVATAKTRMHIKEHSSSSGQVPDSAGTDPWLTNDPWGNFTPVTKAAQVPSQHVQQKFDDVEARLQESLQAHVSETLQQQDDSRICSVENRIQALVETQDKLQAWIADGSQKITDIQNDNHNIHQCIQQCGLTIQEQGKTITQVQADVAQCSQQVISQSHTLQGVAQDLGGLKETWQSTLNSYFEMQADRIEALLSKKQRHS